MIYSNNNGNQSWFGTDNFYVTRKPYTSKAIISGSRTLCTGNSTYNLTNLLPDETVTWSLSNPSVCDIVSSTNSQIVFRRAGNVQQQPDAADGSAGTIES